MNAGVGLNAFISLTPERAARDSGRARRLAKAGSGRPGTPIAGWTVAVKDIIDVASARTTAGSGRRVVAPCDAAVVRRLSQAGAIVVGKANLDEWALGASGRNEQWGDCLNPWDARRLAGGSSSGAAVAVASGDARLGIGTDTAGSLRIPAAFCGVTSLKPGTGWLDTAGILGVAPTLDTVGPIARDVVDCAAAYEVMAGRTVTWARSAELRDGTRLRLAVLRGEHWQSVDAAVGAALAAAGRIFERAGVNVFELEVPSIGEATRVAGVVLLYEVAHRYTSRWRRAEQSGMSDLVRRQLDKGRQISRREYEAALRFRERWLAKLGELYERADVLLHATTAFVAPLAQEHRGTAELTRLCAAWNLAGAPVLALPCGVDDGGLPIGASLVGPPGEAGRSERAVLRLGTTYQSATEWHLRRPLASPLEH